MEEDLSEGLSNEKLAEIWLHHNDLRWRIVTSSPIFSASILVGWYSLEIVKIPIVQNLILLLGIFGMFAYYTLIRRLGDYAGAYYDAIPNKPQIPKPIFGLQATRLAHAIPLLLGSVFLVLLFVDLPVAQSETLMHAR